MKTSFKNLFFILGASRAKLPFLTVIFLCVSLLDLVGLSLVAPYLALVLGNEQWALFSLILSHIGFTEKLSRQELLTAAGLLLLSIYLFKTIVAAALARVVIKFGQDQQVRLKRLLLSRYLSMPYQHYIKRGHPYYTNIINTLTSQFSNLIMIVLQVWGDMIVAVAIVGLLIWTSPEIFLILIVILSAWLVGFDISTRSRLELLGRENVESSEDIFQHTEQALKGFKEIKIFALQSLFTEKLNIIAKRFAAGQTGVNFISMLPKYLLELVIVGFLVCYCILVVWSDEARESMLPTLGVFGVAAIRLLPIVRNFSSSLNRLRSNRLCLQILADDLKDLGTQSHEMGSRPNHQKAPDRNEDGRWALRLENYSFHYFDEEKLVLNGVNLEIYGGEKIGIVGRSGSGKSTLVNSILGLLKPTHGYIRLNGVSLHDVNQDWWQKISYVPQETFVIDDTIKANIALGYDDSEVDADRLRSAIQAANLTEAIAEMPMGIDTPIGGGGIRLSGGQKQRLALARAFYANRQMLILDEAMSALDYETEQLILKRILGEASLTAIIISHREQTLGQCTRILKVSNGSVIEQIF